MFLSFKNNKQIDFLYNIYISNPNSHCFDIDWEISNIDKGEYSLSMANWVPGSYMIRDFAKHIISISIFDKDNAENKIDLIRLNKNSWKFNINKKANLVVKYKVYAFDTAPRGAYLDNIRGFFDGARIFLKLDGFESNSNKINIIKTDKTKAWKVKTSMQSLDIDKNGFGIYKAENYYDLIDYPFVFGGFDIYTFFINEIKHEIVAIGKHPKDALNKLAVDVKQICEGNIRIFGEYPIKDHYIFFLNITNNSYGGIEHNNSSALTCPRKSLPKLKVEEYSLNYLQLLGLFSHEHFHLWNIKRIKPDNFIDLNLNTEVYTEQLWFFEGFTSYFEDLNLIKSKVITKENYLLLLSDTLNSILNNPGTNKQILVESSFYAWTKFYQQDENAPNAIVNYYRKGSLVALCLDLMIIKDTEGNHSLKNIMQYLWQNYGKKNKGLQQIEFINATKEVVGIDYSDFFHLALNTTDPLPIFDLLGKFGVTCEYEKFDLIRNFGINIQANSTKVLNVFDNTKAMESGLAPYDEIIAINFLKVNPTNLLSNFESIDINKEFIFHVFRNEELIELQAIMPETEKKIVKLKFKERLSHTENKLLNLWFGN